MYEDALNAGLEKVGKYYSHLDEKPSFVLALGKALFQTHYEIATDIMFVLVLHPYYKLAYIKLQWGGPEEQAAEIEAGNWDAKDWHDEAKKIVERTVSCVCLKTQYHTDSYKDVSVL